MRFHFVEDILFDHKWVEDDFIGLDHVDKTTKRTAEKAVFIRSSLPLCSHSLESADQRNHRLMNRKLQFPHPINPLFLLFRTCACFRFLMSRFSSF